jgi:hypothetical protein
MQASDRDVHKKVNIIIVELKSLERITESKKLIFLELLQKESIRNSLASNK